jgi:hypothetical protein
MNGMFKDILDSVRESYKPQFDKLSNKVLETKSSKERTKSLVKASIAWHANDFDKAIEILTNYLKEQQ